jgi:Na+-translocating ferredoxin:NAD+ oxidoreductase subunit G
MNEMVRMVAVLTVICGVCALALSGLRAATADRIERQVLTNLEGPTVKVVLAGADNDLIEDRRRVEIDGRTLTLFLAKRDGRVWGVAYETVGSGFGGDIQVMVGYDLDQDRLTGVQIVSHKETPGIGTKITMDQYTKAFIGMPLSTNFALKPDGGDLDAITGATYSARGRAEAVQRSVDLYPKVKAYLQDEQQEGQR